MMIQLNPVVPMITPKGKGYANFLIDRGMEFDNEWIVFLENGEIWSFLNDKVRLEPNFTYKRMTHDENPYHTPSHLHRELAQNVKPSH